MCVYGEIMCVYLHKPVNHTHIQQIPYGDYQMHTESVNTIYRKSTPIHASDTWPRDYLPGRERLLTWVRDYLPGRERLLTNSV